ncbi:MAG TPA: alpha/beta hydrolase [Nitrospiraceae bacterium]|nr:alpha/beta hydrolase [Nitrospiraceae bacterium]
MKLESQWTKIRWGVMHARVHRQSVPGRRVILVHGLVISSRYMEPTAEQLAALCDVYAVDLPGYGLSEKPPCVLSLSELADALSEWMKAEGLTTADFAANSFGCQVLAEFAVRHPDHIDRLVLQGPTIDRTARTFWRQVGRLIKNSRRESPRLGTIMLRDYARAGLKRVIQTVTMALEDRIEDKLPRISMPTLVIRGEHDPIVPQRWAEEVCRLLPHGQLAVISGAAHTLNYTEPSKFVSAMRPFLNL